MTLTVPRAGANAGRAADAASMPVAQPVTGALIADLGNAILEKKAKVRSERNQLALQKTNLDIARDLGQARLDVDQLSDPDQLDQTWQQRSEEIYASRVATIQDPELRQKAELVFQSQNDPQSLAVGERGLTLTRSQREALWVDAQNQIFADAALADPVTFDLQLDAGDQIIDAQLSNGDILPEEAALRKQALRGKAYENRANQRIADDPEAFLSELAAGSYDALGEAKSAFDLKAKAQIASNAKLAEAEAIKADAEFVQNGTAFLKDGIAVLGKGLSFAGAEDAITLLADPRIAKTDAAREYSQAALLQQTLPSFARSTLADKEQLLADAKAMPKEKGYEADVLTAMEASITAHRDGLKTDPLAYAEGLGLKDVATPLPDPASDTAELFTGLRTRVAKIEALDATGLTADPKQPKAKTPIFRPEERDAYAEKTAPGAAPADRLKVATALAGLGPERAQQAADELKADDVFVMITAGVAANAYSAPFARQVFEGQRIIARGDVKLPGETEMRQGYFQDFKRLFADGTQITEIDESRERDAIIATARATYAYRIRETGQGGESFDANLMAQALHEAAGGTGRYGKSDAKGGIQQLSAPDVGSYLVLLPPGVSGVDVQNAYDNMLPLFVPPEDFGQAPEMPKIPDADWAAITVNGRAPVLGGEPVNLETLRRVRLVATEGNTFRLDAEINGEVTTLSDIGGMPVLIDIPKLLIKFGRRK